MAQRRLRTSSKPLLRAIRNDRPQEDCVLQIDHGQDKGRWLWSMVVARPGPTSTNRSGLEEHQRDASRRVVEAYETRLVRMSS
jgi:hypothetical protein